MGTPFMGELKLVAFDFPPKGWANCDGALMQINQNQALFSLLGTNYGGDGRVTFGLPDLRGRVPVHYLTQETLGTRGGEVTHTITTAEMPAHTHVAQGSQTPGNTPIAQNAVFANANLNAYAQPAPPTPIVPATITPTPGGNPHENMSPFQVLTFCIALVGIFPSQN
jgi:microcystin-dependent protein